MQNLYSYFILPSYVVGMQSLTIKALFYFFYVNCEIFRQHTQVKFGTQQLKKKKG